MKDIELDILKQPLEYCLKNDTLSFSNLNDTYTYFRRASHESNEVFKEIQRLERQYQGAHEPLEVTKRSLSVYKELIVNSKGALL